MFPPAEIVLSRLVQDVLRIYGLDGLFKSLKNSSTADDRIGKLAAIQTDLEDAIEAVKQLQLSAKISKQEADDLQSEIVRLQEDKKTAEDLVKVPEEAFARMLSRASAKGRGRGLAEGIAIGLVTGFVSSLLAWYVTK